MAVGAISIGLTSYVPTDLYGDLQASVVWNERGVATGAGQFARSNGSAVGVAIFGATANSIFGHAPVAVS